MVARDPVRIAAVWHSLNNYCYKDAIFLAERLFAEGGNDVLHLLATCYYRAGYIKRAYGLLQKHGFSSIQTRFLLAKCCVDLQKFAEAEAVLTGTSSMTGKSADLIADEFNNLAGVALQLLGNVYMKSDQNSKAAECFRQSLHSNPFLWGSFEQLCQTGEKVDPTEFFKPSEGHEASLYAASRGNIELGSMEDMSENLDPACVNSSLGGAPLLTSTISKPRLQGVVSGAVNNSRSRQDLSSPITPGFGVLPATPNLEFDSPALVTPNADVVAHEARAPVKKQAGKSLRSVADRGSLSKFKTPANNSENVQRRSTRRIANSSTDISRKEIRSSPKMRPMKEGLAPKKVKSRIAKNIVYKPLTPTTQDNIPSPPESSHRQREIDEKPEAKIPSPARGSNDGFMRLLQVMAKAYLAQSAYECREAISLYEDLPSHHVLTCWVTEQLALAYYEVGEYALAEYAFAKVRELDPCLVDEGMAVYSTLLWLARKETMLSSLAQDLVDLDLKSPYSWVAMANNFSLQREHDSAIKFLQRAIQLNPEYAYAYTLLGHEYVHTEELEKGLSCFRTALRHDARHYNAWYGIGMVYFKQEKYTLAEWHFQKALKINPRSSILMCHLAVAQDELGRTEQALESACRAMAINPKNALCKYHKSRFLMNLDRNEEALEELKALQKIAPKDSLVYFSLGKVYQKLEQPHLAQMHFSWAMSLDPQGTNASIKEAMSQLRYVDDTGDSLYQSIMGETAVIEDGIVSALEATEEAVL